MKIIATTSFELYGTHYRKGDQFDATEKLAEKLIRANQARVEPDELLRHLSGQRMTTPGRSATEMRVSKG